MKNNTPLKAIAANQKKNQRCFICKKPETLLVRYILSIRIKKNKVEIHKKDRRKDNKPDKRKKIKKLFLLTSDYERKTITQTYSFICVNEECWRYTDYENLKQEWDIKVWRIKKPSPHPAMISESPITMVDKTNN